MPLDHTDNSGEAFFQEHAPARFEAYMRRKRFFGNILGATFALGIILLCRLLLSIGGIILPKLLECLLVVFVLLSLGNLLFFCTTRFSRLFADWLSGIRRMRSEGEYLCAFTARPRRNTILGGIDDIGWIRVEKQGIQFRGDHTVFLIPNSEIKQLEKKRSFFAGEWVRVVPCPGGKLPFASCDFRELENWTASSSFSMFECLRR